MDEVQCFIQGARYEGRAIRLSTREALVDLPKAPLPPPGTLIGMTFPSRRRGPFGVFLYGRSRTDAAGPLQVYWEKAVTAGSPEDLQWFLAEILDIRQAEVLEEPWGPRQETRRVFLFSSAPDPSPTPVSLPEAPVGKDLGTLPDAAPAPDSREPSDPLEDLELEVIALQADGTPLDRGRTPSSQTSGPVPPEDPLRELQNPLSGRLETEGFGLDVAVVALGRSALRVRTAFLPMSREHPLGLWFRIPTRRGEETVRCECLLREVQDRDLLLAIRKVLEESSEGVLERYLRFVDLPASRGGSGGSGANPRDRNAG